MEPIARASSTRQIGSLETDAMKMKLGNRELEVGGKYFDCALRSSNDILHDREALQARMAEDGYLLIRRLYDRSRIVDARNFLLGKLQEGNCLLPGAPFEDGVVNPGVHAPHTMGHNSVTHQPPIRSVLEGKEIYEFFEHFHGKQVLTYDFKWLRAVKNPDYTGAHYDVVYMGRGSIGKLNTVWTPITDVPLEHGPLAICVGSHKAPGFERLRQTYGRMDVDRDRVGGWFSDDPVEIVEKFGGRWQTTDFRMGDVLIFGMFTMHMSAQNQSDRWRISTDTRFQPADEPVDERWVGENPKAHYAWYSEPEKMVTMSAARESWGV
jgi:hypothetical protein